MNITYAKFFQPVQLIKDTAGLTEVVNYARELEYNMTLDGNFIRIRSKKGGESVLVTIFNVAFLRTPSEATNPSPKTSGKNTPKEKSEQV